MIRIKDSIFQPDNIQARSPASNPESSGATGNQ
jgi:hypothetical protein